MDWILYVLLVLALAGDVLLAVLLARSGRRPPRHFCASKRRVLPCPLSFSAFSSR